MFTLSGLHAIFGEISRYSLNMGFHALSFVKSLITLGDIKNQGRQSGGLRWET